MAMWRLTPLASLPRWFRSRPFLAAEVLRWSNIHRRYRLLLPASIAFIVVVGVLLTARVIGHALEVVAQYPVVPFALLGAAFAISAARRRARIHRSLVDSWLAPLSVRPSVLTRALFAPISQLLLLCAAIAVPTFAGLTRGAALTLWMLIAAACIVGSGLGWLSLSRHKGLTAHPDFHYVAFRKPRPNWAQAPTLEPLSYWAVGQAKVFSKPKVAANAMLVVLLAVPMGIPAQEALALAAGVWVLVYVGSLMLAGIRVPFAAARWLAVTTVGYLRFTASVTYRALLAQLWTWLCILFLIYADGLRPALRLGLPLAVSCLVLSCLANAIAARVSLSSARMRS